MTETKIFNKKNLDVVRGSDYANRPSFSAAFSRDRKKLGFEKVRNGKYVLSDGGNVDSFRVANALREPSYVSLETVLSRRSIIPDTVGMITSVTTKTTARYENTIGTFSYRTLGGDRFFGYSIEGWLRVAETEKALLDYLFLNGSKIPTNQTAFRAIDRGEFENPHCVRTYRWFQSERFQNLEDLDWGKTKKYAQRFDSTKLPYVVRLLEYYGKSRYYEEYR